MAETDDRRRHPHEPDSAPGNPGSSGPGEPGYEGAATVGDDGAVPVPFSGMTEDEIDDVGPEDIPPHLREAWARADAASPRRDTK